ncbi:lipid III flippase WzxE [Erwinia sp. INIA-01]|uniref:lipid III flippase WzxE n=1 Tax=Erwinia sp. INIA01 TaxID=2991500 RepID=UPI0022246311|nr:lipid III flippase WzxE [Erwinia sp. INIA01]MCW1877482.1 lipid III flippase WzxE [Erwinia sp. INIA01]
MSLARASVWTAASTLIKIAAGLLVVKMLAVSYGPSGVGQAGNFRQLITVLGVLAGAGIFNGVTKLVAQHQQQPTELRAVTGTASAMVLGFSLLLAVGFLLFAAPISQALFDDVKYQQVIRIVAFLQLGIAWANLALAIVKGFRDAAGNALALIVGSIIGVAAWFVCYWLGGYSGALVGLAMVPALVMIPAMAVLARRDHLPMHYLLPVWQPQYARQLGKFTVMALITAVTLPVAWVMMRNLLQAHAGWEQVGLWQGVSSISDAYLQFITASFSVWLLPTLARLENKADISREIIRALRFVLPAVMVASFCVWLLRDFAIWLLFSSQFTGMRDLFVWQLIGDVLKVGCYVFGYLVIAKASLRFYILTEVSQFILLTGFSRWLIPLHGAAGAAQAYMATYIAYFALCAGVFTLYRRR